MAHYSVEQRVAIVRHTIVGLVRRDGHDLTARQLGVFLTTYLEGEPQTVRGLAAALNVAKPVISHALDRLSDFGLVRRERDPSDRRSISVRRTTAGQGLLRDLRKIVADGDGPERADRFGHHAS